MDSEANNNSNATIVSLGGNSLIVRQQRSMDLPGQSTLRSHNRAYYTRKLIQDSWELPGSENMWNQQFSILRSLTERTLLDGKQQINPKEDVLSYLLTDYGYTDLQCAVEVARDFCYGLCLEDVIRANGRAGQWRSVWLDDRCCFPELEGSGEARCYKNPLSATGLYQALKQERFEHENLPDAARRLIYVSDLDPACIYALVSTASYYQIPALRKGIYKHLHFQSSIEVNMPSSGFLTFALHLHIPFFVLRDTHPEKPVGKVNTKPQRKWTDLSFLELDTSESPEQDPKKVWGIYEAHFSCVATGSDEWRWVGYAFVDAEIDGLLHESSEDDLAFDQIASKQQNANRFPIWRPRDWWLRVLEIRIEQAKKAWEYLIHKVEFGVHRYANKHHFILSRRSGIAHEEEAEIKAAFDWTVQSMGLLCRLDGVLSTTIDAWRLFSGPDGDIRYFQRTKVARISSDARRSLHSTTSIFRELEEIQSKIRRLNKRCTEFKEILQLRLIVESKETADGNGTNTEFTVSVLYPIALAAAIFSMQQPAIPFALNPRSFVFTSLILIIMVYATRSVVRLAMSRWSFLRRRVVLWFHRKEIAENGGKDDHKRHLIFDEERNVLGTSAVRGQPVI